MRSGIGTNYIEQIGYGARSPRSRHSLHTKPSPRSACGSNTSATGYSRKNRLR